ncbi:hypothetical protein TVAG_224770, partial [Trichomonas vaginalis G3]
KEPEPELKSVNLNTASNANATSDVKLEYPPLDQILSREANDNLTQMFKQILQIT